MMEDAKKLSTEEQILEAAEKVFLEKGFKNSKISNIAELAGVNNALINYYFRSKENLFDKVLRSKVGLLAHSLSHVADREIPFEELLKNVIETQFDFFKNNDSLPRFLITEILTDSSQMNMFREDIVPIIIKAGMHLNDKLQQEIAAGNIRNLSMFELLYLITAVNVFCFIVKPIVVGVEEGVTALFLEAMEDRKKKNAEIVMSYLKNISK
ncbi:MAG: TetR/AcrR family transcriptional regulator [Bacteroidales bacterium]|jgi:AcrR family transcriptional regulator|nr:TetR/AcrR family transcriptional regulator [Bacteroidales bacterium]